MGFSFRGKAKQENAVVAETSEVGIASGRDSSSEDVSTTANATLHLQRVKEQHIWDPFMDYDQIDAVDNALLTGDLEKEAATEKSILAENSPYIEVRSAVSVVTKCNDWHMLNGLQVKNTDDPEEYVE